MIVNHLKIKLCRKKQMKPLPRNNRNNEPIEKKLKESQRISEQLHCRVKTRAGQCNRYALITPGPKRAGPIP